MPGTANSGRNAKSTALHVLKGTFRKGRHSGYVSPEPPSGTPKPPKKLSGEERAEWERMVDRLEQNKTLSVVDDAALYQYVQLFAETEQVKTDHADVRKLSADLKKSTDTLEGRDLVDAIKEIVTLQFLIGKQTLQLRQGHMAIRQYLVEFGMTPSARTRVKLPAQAPTVDPRKARYS